MKSVLSPVRSHNETLRPVTQSGASRKPDSVGISGACCVPGQVCGVVGQAARQVHHSVMGSHRGRRRCRYKGQGVGHETNKAERALSVRPELTLGSQSQFEMGAEMGSILCFRQITLGPGLAGVGREVGSEGRKMRPGIQGGCGMSGVGQ